ncbi:MAG: hypothetical protein R6U38_04285 [Desulfatiglandaceae bacterium]
MSPTPYRLKTLFSWTLMVGTTAITLCLVLVSLTSLWVGVKYIQRTGSWIPILSGAMLLALGAWIHFRLTTGIYRRLKQKDLLD